MGTLTIRWTTKEDVKRWESLERRGKLGPRQAQALAEWRKTNGKPLNNQIGDLLLQSARENKG